MSLMQEAKTATPEEGVRLTEAAADKVRSIIAENGGSDTAYLYVGVKGGGCSGLKFVLDLRDTRDVEVHETDEVFESRGIPVVCDLKSYVVGNLSGTEIDYVDSFMESGFQFNNPNFKRQCGCGQSYCA